MEDLEQEEEETEKGGRCKNEKEGVRTRRHRQNKRHRQERRK